MNERDTAIDITKAIGILLVIIGHCAPIPYIPYRHFIYTFHMPLFFIISGYFFRRKDNRTLLISDFKYLMIPYFVTCVTVVLLVTCEKILTGHGGVIHYVLATFIGSGSKHGCLFLSDLPSIGAIWFFPALLVCKNVYNLISTYSINQRLVFSAIIYLIATLIGRYVIFIPFSVLSGLSAIIFYSIGDYYRTKKTRITWGYLIIGILCWVISFKYSCIYLVQPRTDLYFIDVIGATTATFFLYKISIIISNWQRINKLLLWIGKYTMYILCFHLIDINVGISNMLTNNLHPIMLVISMLTIPLVATLGFVKIKDK